jgi:hypothetical protein
LDRGPTPAFVELGYGLYTARWDEARDDLRNQHGRTGLLRTHPGIAWLLAAGVAAELSPDLALTVRLSYRVRYYNRRGGEPLADELVHGTQDLTPFFGVAYRFPRARAPSASRADPPRSAVR